MAKTISLLTIVFALACGAPVVEKTDTPQDHVITGNVFFGGRKVPSDLLHDDCRSFCTPYEARSTWTEESYFLCYCSRFEGTISVEKPDDE